MSNPGELVRAGATARALACWLSLALALVGATARFAAAAEEVDATATIPRAAPPGWGVTAGLGVRSDLIRSGGLDPFSRTDDVSQSALSVSYRLVGSEFSGLAAGFEWNRGTATATARGASASLDIDRFTLPIEWRVQVARRLSVFARVAPGAVRDRARLIDSSVPAGAYGGASSDARALEQVSWLFAGDVSAGLALRFAEILAGGAPRFGFWLTADGGYGYVGAHDLTLAPRVETQPGRVDEPVRLGQLALSGPFLRARLALSF